MEPAIKPCLQYVGSKSRLAPRINALLGNGTGAYVEPFFGSGAVLLSRPAAKVELINDLHEHLYRFYTVLRNEATRYRLIEALSWTPYARKSYEEAVAATLDFDSDPVEAARLFFVRANQGYVATSAGTWTSTMSPSSRHSNATKWNNYRTRLFAVAERLQNVQIECTDAVSVISKAAEVNSPELAMYLDPPYMHETRNGSKYACDDMREQDHRHMLTLVHGLPGPTVVSGYSNPLYDSVLDQSGGWSRLEVAQSANSASGRGSVSNRVEVLWYNSACVSPAG